jgi:hypothetical protein
LPLPEGSYALMHDEDGCEHVIRLGSQRGPRGRQLTVLGGRLARHNFECPGWFEPERFSVLELTREEAEETLRKWERERAIVDRVLRAALQTAGRLPRRDPPSAS